METSAYKDVYVFAEQRNGQIQPVALELLGKAKDLANELQEKTVALLFGKDISKQADLLTAYGADKVIIVDSSYVENYTTEPYTQAITQICKECKPGILLFGATTTGRDLAPRVSARLQTGLTADCTKLEISEDKHLLMTRPAFGGNLMATITCKEHRPQLSTVRPGVMQKISKNEGAKGEIISFKVNFDPSKFRVKLISKTKEEKAKVNITDANILISAGRGAGSKEKLSVLGNLADLLKAEISCSRALVDTGLVPHERQVGQTGKTVRPNVYFAFGISGAVQHLAGMEDSDLIIAINKDKTAPIFQSSDLGIVGDLGKIAPLLVQRLKKEMNNEA